MALSGIAPHALGALAALSSAFCWAISAIIFRQLGDVMSALAMNLVKGVIALILMGLLLSVNGMADIEQTSYWFLALSGVAGILLGDTLYFLTLVRLGPRITLLVGSLIPVVTGLVAVAVLGEHVAALGWFGIVVTLAGVSYVLWDKTKSSPENTVWLSGLGFAVLFVLANAAGIIFSKIGVENVPALDATFVRQLWAVAGLTFWGLAARSLIPWVKPLRDKVLLVKMLIAGVIGAFIGTWLSIVAIKYTHAAVAAALNSTSPLFILPLAYFFYKEKITLKGVVGTVTAVCGVALYFVSMD